MSILHRLFGKRSRGSAHMETKQYCIVDANGFIEKRFREANGQPSPRDNFYVLKNLSYFVQREDIKMAAVFIGRPLREAGEGESFKGVTVFYAGDEKSLIQKISQLTRSGTAGKEVIVITDNRQTEQEVIKLGAQCMRLATLKKGMEGGFDHDRQPQRQNQRRPPAETEPQHQPAEEKAPPEGEKVNKNVLDLIDPI